MILLLGADSYVGQGFARILRARGQSFVPLVRDAYDFTRFDYLLDYVRSLKPELVINAEEVTETANWERNGLAADERISRGEMFRTNYVLAKTVSGVCSVTKTALGHVSSGKIYRGAKLLTEAGIRTEENLGRNDVQLLFSAQPESLLGFTEIDPPNFSFKQSGTYYSGTKALAEEAVTRHERAYVWRFGPFFSEINEPGNVLSQVQEGLAARNRIYSLSHREECLEACLELWERQANFGIYNVVNPGVVTTQEIWAAIQRILKPARRLRLLVYDDRAGVDLQLMAESVLDGSKLQHAGIQLKRVHLAVEGALKRWESRGVTNLSDGVVG